MKNLTNLSFTNCEEKITEKIKLYRNVFGNEPWNEGFICGNCGKTLSLNFIGKCECGEINNFKPYYQYSELKLEFEQLSGLQGYKETIAKILDKRIGLIWGWESNLVELNQQKLGLNTEDFQTLRNNILSIFPEFNESDFYYFSEIAVLKDFRGKDVAGKLYRTLLERLKQENKEFIIVRTTKNADVPYLWFKKMGYQDVYNYNDELNRVILINKI